MTENSITVSKNLSKVDEMSMNTEKYALCAEVESAKGNVRAINNGVITDIETGAYLGTFNFYGIGNQNVSLQGVTSREDRATIYETVENFIEAVTAEVTSEIDEKEDVDAVEE